MAINGYDDDRESVLKYVDDAGLKHPIVLEGGKVAVDLFHVGAYPTSFWVKSDGTVLDYEVGFHSLERLERRVKSLMRK